MKVCANTTHPVSSLMPLSYQLHSSTRSSAHRGKSAAETCKLLLVFKSNSDSHPAVLFFA